MGALGIEGPPSNLIPSNWRPGADLMAWPLVVLYLR
jgi:hypothetical protein